jgi:uncharacterized protein Yka (UPF0111/DUF47 family)
MTTSREEIEQLADEVSPWSAAIASRLRAVAWRVGRLERAADEIVDDARVTERRAAWVARKRLAG